ncbi:MAG TPA: amidase [Micropepsaceae bacterium]|jgi:amidase|nr:amidase [Micropepsaceae bacterium]
MARLNERSACDIARGVAAGTFTAEAVVRDCLARIEERDKDVKAWAFIDPELALTQARAIDRNGAKGVLSGVPLGIKDIIDTFDMPTDMGSPIYRNNRTAADASSVALARRAGAVILGKTITCEFAGLTPNVTCNPRNLDHSPGGSSSGSAAAVADAMCAVGYGTQTGGSVLRPASFCGAVGYKPTYNLIARGGIKFAAESRDTIGLIGRSVDDVDLVASVLIARPLAPVRDTPPRIGLCRTHLWDAALPESKAAIENTARRLEAAGARIHDVALPESFAVLQEARTIVNPVERARSMAHEWNTNRALISPGLTRQIEEGLSIPHARYIASLQRMKECRDGLPDVFGDCDVLLVPCVTGEAPKGLASTGDTRFQEFWTALHTPAITLPTHNGPNGLPIGIQFVAPLYKDETLLSVARWAAERLAA